MGAFDNIQFTEYKPTYVGIPTEQFIKTVSALNSRYEQASENIDKVHTLLGNTNADQSKMPQLKEIGDNINNDLKQYIQDGNLEDANLAIKNTVQKNIISNPVYKGINQDFQNRQVFLSGLDEDVKKGLNNGGISKDYADRIKKYVFDLVGNEPISIDDKGNIKGVFKPIIPAKEIDFTSEMVKIGKDVEESTYIDILKKYPGIQGYLYQDTHTGRDPKRIQAAIKSYILNSPDAKSYINFKSELDYHNKYYNSTTKSYNKPTTEDIENVGYNVYKSILGPPTSPYMLNLKDGDITYPLGPIPVKDSKGNDTNVMEEGHSYPIGNINDDNISNIWKLGRESQIVNQPMSATISSLSGEKTTRQLVKDVVFMANYEHSLKLRDDAIKAKKDKFKTLPSGYELLGKNVVEMPKDYNDIADIKNNFLVFNHVLRNSINNTTLTNKEKTLLSGFLMNKHNYTYDEISKFVKWTDPAQVYILTNERDIARSKYDTAIMIDSKAKSYAKIKDDNEIKNITDKYMAQAYNDVTSRHTMAYGSANVITTETYKPYKPSQEVLLQRATELALLNNDKFVKYQSFLDAQQKQANVLTPTNIFGGTPTETEANQELIAQGLKEGSGKGGALTVWDLNGNQIKDDKRNNIVNNISKATIRVDRIPGHDGWSVLGRQIKSIKNGIEELGDYVIVDGITGIDNMLLSSTSSARLLPYKDTMNKSKVTPGIPTYLEGTRNARVTTNLANPDRPNDPPSYVIETWNGENWVGGDVPLFTLRDVYNDFDRIYDKSNLLKYD